MVNEKNKNSFKNLCIVIGTLTNKTRILFQLDADGNMKEDVISKYIKEQISTAKFPEDVQNKIIDTCIKEAKNMTRNTDQSEATCNPVPLKLAHCVFREVSCLVLAI